MHPIYQSNANDTLTSFILEEVTLGLYSMHKILSGQNTLAEATYMYFNIIIRSNLVMNDIQRFTLAFWTGRPPVSSLISTVEVVISVQIVYNNNECSF